MLHLQHECQFLFHFEKFYLVLSQIYLITLIARLSLFNFFWIIEHLLLRPLVPVSQQALTAPACVLRAMPACENRPLTLWAGLLRKVASFRGKLWLFVWCQGSAMWCHFKLKSGLEVFVCFFRGSIPGGVCCKRSGEHMYVHVYLHFTPQSAKFKAETLLGGIVLSLMGGGVRVIPPPD